MSQQLQNIIEAQSPSIYIFDSEKKGNITTIMVWVHGNELSWPNAIIEIIKTLKIQSWKVFIIFANLKALQQNVRQTEKNMNRSFVQSNTGTTYEDKRAREIMKILEKSDYLLDIHNTLNIENSIPFLISEHPELWKYFDVEKIVSGFDELHPGGSDGYMNEIWKIWLCLESGSIYDPKWPEIAKKWILNFLKYTKNIVGIPETFSNQEYIKFDTIYKNKTLDFKFTKTFEDFEKIEKWQIIWYDGNTEIFSDRDGYIIFTYIPKYIGDEVFCLGTWIEK